MRARRIVPGHDPEVMKRYRKWQRCGESGVSGAGLRRKPHDCLSFRIETAQNPPGLSHVSQDIGEKGDLRLCSKDSHRPRLCSRSRTTIPISRSGTIDNRREACATHVLASDRACRNRRRAMAAFWRGATSRRAIFLGARHARRPQCCASTGGNRSSGVVRSVGRTFARLGRHSLGAQAIRPPPELDLR